MAENTWGCARLTSCDQVCDEAMQPRSARMVADVCNCDAVEVTAKGVLCEPKTYHVCRFDRATHMQMVANARARTGRTGGRLTPEMEKAKEETCGASPHFPKGCTCSGVYLLREVWARHGRRCGRRRRL